jgi:hypothetical protein
MAKLYLSQRLMKSSMLYLKNIFKYRVLNLKKIRSIEDLVDIHFRFWSEADHINRKGLLIALKEINCEKPVVVETGTSAYGTNSSRLFDVFVKFRGGTFYSVDIDPKASRRLVFQHSRRSYFYTDDSVNFLTNKLVGLTEKVCLFYLDSWDVDWNNPIASSSHGLSEFRALSKYICKGSVLMVDDTPSKIDYIPQNYHKIAFEFQDKHGVLPGKGSFILSELLKIHGVEILWHEYSLVVKFNEEF